jgi:hypothetical protein
MPISCEISCEADAGHETGSRNDQVFGGDQTVAAPALARTEANVALRTSSESRRRSLPFSLIRVEGSVRLHGRWWRLRLPGAKVVAYVVERLQASEIMRAEE